MNYGEAHTLINGSMALIAEKFEEVYPDTFIKSKTLDPETYKNANPCMYSWYMAVVRGISEVNLSPQYAQTEEEHTNNDWSSIERFISDLQDAEDFLHFVIEHVQIKL